MSKSTIYFRMIITTIALVGIILMQLYWINDTIKLKRDQFDTGVSVILKSLTNRLLTDYRNENDSIANNATLCVTADLDITETVDPAALDILLHDEFDFIKDLGIFHYGIYNSNTKNFVMGQFEGHEKEILASEYSVSLLCLCAKKPVRLGIYFPGRENYFFKQVIWWLILTALFLLILIVGYAVTLYGLLTSKKVSEMKSDFLNNMTHEFKTPIATISLASEMLKKKEVYNDSEKTLRYGNIIFDENNRLQSLVDRILQMTVIDRKNYRINKDPLNAHEAIIEVVKNFSLLLKDRNGFIITKLEATKPVIMVDKLHFTNIITNIIDNANKYSPSAPNIIVKSWNTASGFNVSIADNGIGISRDNQKHIYKNLFRVSTGDLHDAKGFGMGLYYVKRMVGLHKGKIDVESEPGKGTTFTLFFPFKD